MIDADVALGVECAIPAGVDLCPPKRRRGRLLAWLTAVLAGRF